MVDMGLPHPLGAGNSRRPPRRERFLGASPSLQEHNSCMLRAMCWPRLCALEAKGMLAQFSAIFGGMGGDRGRGQGIIGLLVVAIVMPIVATIIRMAISRTREFQADAKGARTNGNPEALARALEKLEMGSQVRPMKVPEAASHLFIVNPLSGRSMAKLFSTHPPIEERIRRLRSMPPNY